MELRVKNLDISSGGPLISILNKEDAKRLDLKPLDRIKLKLEKKEIVVAIDIIYKSSTIKPGQIGLFEEVIDKLKCRDKCLIKIELEPSPTSIQYIKNKLEGKSLLKHEIDEIIHDIIDNRLTEIEMTYFISACYTHGLNLYESAYLTEAIVASGKQLKLNRYPILDKHCVSGIPGNRTTMIATPIIAAAGFTMAKTSTRSITSASGTADTMEVLAPVSHSLKNIKKIITKTNACMVWGGALELASADDKLIKLERPLSLDPEGILLASILAKKLAVGATHVLIDIPLGKYAKINDPKKAKRLKRKFKYLGKLLGMETKVIITDGSQPIGNGIGPALEARDVLSVLLNKGPEDLKAKSLLIASILLKMVGVSDSYKLAKDILESGKAYKKMQEIIKAQGGNPNIKPEDIQIGKFKYEFKSKTSGNVHEINNKILTKIAKVAGAPENKGAGVYIYVKLKNRVKKNQTLFTIYSENKKKLDYAIPLCKKNPIEIK